MKKILTTVVLIATGAVSCAQYADFYYHRHGDTVDGKAENGYYQWWDFDQYRAEGRFASYSWKCLPGKTELHYFYTPQPLKIIGMAAILDTTLFYGQKPMSECQYLYIHEATPEGHRMVAEVEMLSRTMPEGRKIVIHHNGYPPSRSGGQGYSEQCCEHRPFDMTYNLFEFYFDTPVTVEDSFYVGGSGMPFRMTEQCITYQTFTTTAYYGCNDEPDYTWENLQHCFYVHPTLQYANGEWSYQMESYVLAVYPIVEVDTTVVPQWACPQPAGLEVTVVDSTTAVVQWDPFPNYTQVEIAYGNTDTTVLHADTLVDGETHYVTLTGLSDTKPHHWLRARALCDSSGSTPIWSDSVFFRTFEGGDDDEPQGIESPSLASQVSLSPNPAGDAVEVFSPFGMRYIEVYDLKGTPVYSNYAHQMRERIPLNGWRTGTYVVQITTSRGVITKVLVKR